MPAISVLIKPASGACNLNCKYCFYNDIIDNREMKNYGMMSKATLEELVKKVFEYGDNIVGFAFQGGEPTLMGLDFYKHLITLQQKYNLKKVKVNNAIQTNGMIIDEEWAKFLAENNFLVGLSLDGTKDIHNMNRIDKNGEGSYNRVEKTIEYLNRYEVKYNVLTVVTKSVARHVNKIYKYYRKCNLEYFQFIPCLDDLGMKAGQNPYSLTPKLYGEFLKKLFDLWYEDCMNGKNVSIRMFDNIVDILLGYYPEACDMMGRCSANLVVEADGSAYPCDFYVLDKWKMGNILDNSIKNLLQGNKAIEFVQGSDTIHNNCNGCKFISICRGGCRRNYEPISNVGSNKNYFCSSYYEFYEYTINRLQRIANMVRG